MSNQRAECCYLRRVLSVFNFKHTSASPVIHPIT